MAFFSARHSLFGRCCSGHLQVRKTTKSACRSITILMLYSYSYSYSSGCSLSSFILPPHCYLSKDCDLNTMDHFETYTTTFPIRSRRPRSSTIPGATLHPAIYSTSSTILRDNLISFLSYVKTRDIPILPVTRPDVRSVLGQGASFLVNGAEMPETYTDPVSGTTYPQGKTVAFKRAVLSGDMHPIQDRIRVLFNEILTMQHPPLIAHPNIVKLYGVAFETENMGVGSLQNAIPVLILEVAELGNLAEVLETAKREERPLRFEDKVSLCLDIAHGLEILHACGS